MKKKNRIRIAAVLTAAMLTVSVSGCGGQSESEAPEKSTETTKETEQYTTAEESVAEDQSSGTSQSAGTEQYTESDQSAENDQNTQEAKVDSECPRSEVGGFFTVTDNPLSTFGMDVDTASYTNMRRMIREGYGARSFPEGSIRTEELLNYFTYDFEAPQGEEKFAVTSEVSRCPWNKDNYLVMAGVKTRDLKKNEIPSSNLVFLLDVSGSMSDEDKLPLLQEAFSMLTKELGFKDRVSIVTYASGTEVIIDGVRGSSENKILSAIEGLDSGGSTNGSSGLEVAYQIAEENFIEGGNNRIIMATDGDLNAGIDSESGLQELISEKRESGIYLSVLGFGADNMDDGKMEILADNGNGNYSYIDSEEEAERVLVQERNATLVTVAKDAKIQVEFNPNQVKSYRLIGYENRVTGAMDFIDDEKDGGETGAGQTVVALYEITPVHKDGIKLKYQDGYYQEDGATSQDAETSKEQGQEEYATVSISYKEPAGEDSTIRQYPIGTDCYTQNPDEDFLFAASVAELGMIINNTDGGENYNLKNVRDRLVALDPRAEERQEFCELVEELYDMESTIWE